MYFGPEFGVVAIIGVFLIALVLFIVAYRECDLVTRRIMAACGVTVAIGNFIGMLMPGPVGGFATAWLFVLLLGGWTLFLIWFTVKFARR